MSTKSNENNNEGSQVNPASFGCACGSGSGEGRQSGGCSIKRNLTTAVYYTVVLLGLGAAVLSIWG